MAAVQDVVFKDHTFKKNFFYFLFFLRSEGVADLAVTFIRVGNIYSRMAEPKRLYLGRDAKLGGVCSGIAEYFEVDPTLVRLIWIVVTLLSMGLGLVAYFIFWIVMPEKPKR